jgi:hypothetical protein
MTQNLSTQAMAVGWVGRRNIWTCLMLRIPRGPVEGWPYGPLRLMTVAENWRTSSSVSPRLCKCCVPNR